MRYVEAFKALEYSVDGNTVYNPTATDVYIKTLDRKQVSVKAGERVKI